MEFINGITHEQMIDIMKGKNQGLEGKVIPCVYTVRINNHHMYQDKNVYQIYVESVPVQSIIVDYETGDWHLLPVNDEIYDLPVFITKKEAVENVKAKSRFWEVEGFDSVKGWSVSEAEMIQVKEHPITSDVLNAAKEGLYRDAFIEAAKTFHSTIQRFPSPYSEFADKFNKDAAALIVSTIKE